MRTPRSYAVRSEPTDDETGSRSNSRHTQRDTDSQISSRTRLNTASTSASFPAADAGSSKDQRKVRTGLENSGQLGPASLQTVITQSGRFAPRNSYTDAERLCPISTPISRMMATARGFSPLGSVPAAKARRWSPAMCWAHPAAIWLRHEAPVQTKRTRLFSVMFWRIGRSNRPRGGARTGLLDTRAPHVHQAFSFVTLLSDSGRPDRSIPPWQG